MKRSPQDAVFVLVCIEKTVGDSVHAQTQNRAGPELPVIDLSLTTAQSISLAPSSAPSSGYYQIKSSADNSLCISLTDCDISKNANLRTCNGHDYQKCWIRIDYKNVIKCLEVAQDLTANNNFYLADCGAADTSPRQQWTITVDNELENGEYGDTLVVGIESACSTTIASCALLVLLENKGDCSPSQDHQRFVFFVT